MIVLLKKINYLLWSEAAKWRQAHNWQYSISCAYTISALWSMTSAASKQRKKREKTGHQCNWASRTNITMPIAFLVICVFLYVVHCTWINRNDNQWFCAMNFVLLFFFSFSLPNTSQFPLGMENNSSLCQVNHFCVHFLRIQSDGVSAIHCFRSLIVDALHSDGGRVREKKRISKSNIEKIKGHL